MRLKILCFGLVIGLSCMVSLAFSADDSDIRGAWRPELYQMKDGTRHEVTGLITFTEKDWSVLLFIMKKGEPERGSGEGGTYTLDVNKLVFRHLYYFAAGKAIPGVSGSVPPSDLPLTARKPDAPDIPSEACTLEVKDDLLTIDFPSGNLIRFRRSSAP